MILIPNVTYLKGKDSGLIYKFLDFKGSSIPTEYLILQYKDKTYDFLNTGVTPATTAEIFDHLAAEGIPKKDMPVTYQTIQVGQLLINKHCSVPNLVLYVNRSDTGDVTGFKTAWFSGAVYHERDWNGSPNSKDLRFATFDEHVKWVPKFEAEKDKDILLYGALGQTETPELDHHMNIPVTPTAKSQPTLGELGVEPGIKDKPKSKDKPLEKIDLNRQLKYL